MTSRSLGYLGQSPLIMVRCKSMRLSILWRLPLEDFKGQKGELLILGVVQKFSCKEWLGNRNLFYFDTVGRDSVTPDLNTILA